MSSTKTAAKIALAGIAALTLSACGKQQGVIECHGVSKQGPQGVVFATKGECNKLANSSVQPLTAAEAAVAKPYPASSYIKCYGVAASGKNDCATKTAACGGTVTQAGDPTAWIAIPEPLCLQVKNGVVGKVGSDQ